VATLDPMQKSLRHSAWTEPALGELQRAHAVGMALV
jgi:hypothetical protein